MCNIISSDSPDEEELLNASIEGFMSRAQYMYSTYLICFPGPCTY